MSPKWLLGWFTRIIPHLPQQVSQQASYLAVTTLFRMIRHTLSQFELWKNAQPRQEKMGKMDRRQRVGTPGPCNLKVWFSWNNASVWWFHRVAQPIFGENCHKARGKLASRFLAQLGQSDLTAMERERENLSFYFYFYPICHSCYLGCWEQACWSGPMMHVINSDVATWEGTLLKSICKEDCLGYFR